ncbi:MAG: hypothetical protein AABX17_00710 [Nanoarchaeota archaeon]
MKIEFYEEFPTSQNLRKLKLIKFKTKLFIAASNLKEFQNLEKKVKAINKKIECAYWPTVKNSYWISPFSDTKDLDKLFEELDSCKNKILIDLEFPKNLILFFKNLLKFKHNQKLIENFLRKNAERITTAQNPLFSAQPLGINYPVNLEKGLMWYSSVCIWPLNSIIKRMLKKLKNKENYNIALGTIAKGIYGIEPILKPEGLERDLEFVKKAGFKKVTIFRLGGLDKQYISVLNKYIR